MSLLDQRSTTAVVPVPDTAGTPSAAVPRSSFGRRMVAAVTLAAAGWVPLYTGVLPDALSGSRSAYVLAVPFLVTLIAAGHRSAPRGVGDAESDWIVAVLVGGAGLTAIHLLGERLPTLAGLWRLSALTGVVWFACVLIVLFGVRHVTRMRALWVFALTVTTPLPVLLAGAQLGGGDRAMVAVAAAVGAVAVALATPGRTATIRWGAAAACLLAGLLTAALWTPGSGVLVPTLVTAGVLPVAITLAVNGFGARAVTAPAFAPPTRSTTSTVALVVLALTVLVTTAPAGARVGDPVPGVGDGPAAWGTPTSFGFITRYLGPGSTLQRYSVPAVDGLPAAAVDVISTPNAGALRDIADAVWYPSARPLDYRAAAPSAGFPPGARTIHSNADAATTATGPQWYAVTWPARHGAVHQQITVIVSQSLTGSVAPPPPAPLSVTATSLRPALWLARQQPDDTGAIDDVIRGRATDLAAQFTAAQPAGGSTGV